MYKIYCAGELICDSRIDDIAIIDPVVTLEANAAGSFTFTFPSEHPFKDSVKRRNTIVSVYLDDSTEPVFQGIPVYESTDFYGQRSIECEGELTYLNDSILRPAHREGLTVRQLLEAYISEHNDQVDDYKKFAVGVVTVTDSTNSITCYTNYQSTLTEIKEDLVDDLGGYIRVRYDDGIKYIDYLKDSPHTSNQTIELGKNLKDYSSNIDDTDIITRIIPRGERLSTQTVAGLDDYLTIKSVNDNKDYLDNSEAIENYGIITGIVDWSDVTTASALKSKAEKYIEDEQFENVVLNVSAIDFGLLMSSKDKFRVLDSIRVISAAHGMDKWFTLTKQTLNLNNPETDTVTLGKEESTTLSAKSSSAQKQLEQTPSISFMDSAISNATALITGVEGGYVVINQGDDGKPFEILIMDTDDIESATKVWRWNKNGLGYSSTGYSGSYGLAMTSDGSIVANFITSGTLSCSRLNGGTISGQSISGGTVSGSTITGGSISISDASYSGNAVRVYNGSNKAASMTSYKVRTGWDGNYSELGSGTVVAGTYTGNIDASGTVYSQKASMNYLGNLTCSGTKSRAVETDDYNTKLLYCLESPSPMFEDIGEGQIDDTGKCYVYIETVFSETIDTECQYQVFISPYGEGNAYVSEREPDHFVVTGTTDLRFGWRIVAVQNKYDSIRLEDIETSEADETSKETYSIIEETSTYLDDFLYNTEMEEFGNE